MRSCDPLRDFQKMCQVLLTISKRLLKRQMQPLQIFSAILNIILFDRKCRCYTSASIDFVVIDNPTKPCHFG